MKIISIDASTKSTGVAILEDDKLIEYFNPQNNSKSLIERIEFMTDVIKEILNSYPDITTVVLEEVRPDTHSNSIQTLRALMWLQGSIVTMIYNKNPKIKVEYLYPSSWRAAIGIQTGRGRDRKILKQEDIKFVKEKYGIDVNDDIADAIGIGLGYFNKNKEEKKAW